MTATTTVDLIVTSTRASQHHVDPQSTNLDLSDMGANGDGADSGADFASPRMKVEAPSMLCDNALSTPQQHGAYFDNYTSDDHRSLVSQRQWTCTLDLSHID